MTQFPMFINTHLPSATQFCTLLDEIVLHTTQFHTFSSEIVPQCFAYIYEIVSCATQFCSWMRSNFRDTIALYRFNCIPKRLKVCNGPAAALCNDPALPACELAVVRLAHRVDLKAGGKKEHQFSLTHSFPTAKHLFPGFLNIFLCYFLIFKT